MIKRKWTKEEIKEYTKTHGGTFYYNKEDSNFLVPRTYGFGISFNWASPITWIFIFIIIILVIATRCFL